MPRPLFILGFAGMVALLQGCSLSSNQQSQQVQQIGEGMYSIGISKSSSLSASHTELDEAVGKAGDYCHAKGLKLANTHAISNSITFRCASDAPIKPQ